MKAYQCSKCKYMEDMEEYARCKIGIDPRRGYRGKGDVKKCRENFKIIPKDKRWFSEFSWEKY